MCKNVTTFLVLIWGHAVLSYVSFKDNWQDKDRRLMCPKDASREEAGSQNGPYFVPVGKAVRILCWIMWWPSGAHPTPDR